MIDDEERVIRLTEKELRGLVKDAVHETFVALGVDPADPIEMQKDFQHLRDMRMTMAAVKQRGLLTIVAIAVTGLAAMVWLSLGGGTHK